MIYIFFNRLCYKDIHIFYERMFTLMSVKMNVVKFSLSPTFEKIMNVLSCFTAYKRSVVDWIISLSKIPCSVTINYFRKSVFAVKMTVKKLCMTCNRLVSCKSSFNRHMKVCHGERRQEKEESKNYYTLKLCVTVKKTDHEIKTILQDTVILLKMNMRAEC